MKAHRSSSLLPHIDAAVGCWRAAARALAAALLLSACLRDGVLPPEANAPGEKDAPAVSELMVRDRAGERWPTDAMPRRPIIELAVTRPVHGEPEPVMLLRGPADEQLRDDLARSSLLKRTEARLLEAHVTRRDDHIELRPAATLQPGSQYAVAVGGWAHDDDETTLGEPFADTVRVAERRAGAVVSDSWPADATAGVPAALSVAAVRFDDAVWGADEGVRLATGDGDVLPADVEAHSCAEIGWHGGHCVLLRPRRALRPGSEHRLTVGASVHDRTGAPVGPWQATFWTASGRVAPVQWVESGCGIDEQPAGPGCALAGERRVELRVQASGPVRLRLDARDHHATAVAPRGGAVLVLDDLAPERRLEAALHAIDLAGRELRRSFALQTTPELAPLFITEVRADPDGPEPQQEYVEVHNAGPVPLELTGFALADRPDREGDAIGPGHVLPAGARALLVADRFDPDHPDDEPVPPGVPLVRLGSSLTSSGLTNRGETLYLRDADGYRVSGAPATPAPREGVCRVRVVEDGRTAAPGAFGYDAEDGCTPGRPDRIP